MRLCGYAVMRLCGYAVMRDYKTFVFANPTLVVCGNLPIPPNFKFESDRLKKLTCQHLLKIGGILIKEARGISPTQANDYQLEALLHLQSIIHHL
ncbi:hypothetical protein D3A96_03490 [Robertkochia marina]|nr:hypothetical protein D3A96_03490 [Robertkochia marina]